jgi:hypothetical protein
VVSAIAQAVELLGQSAQAGTRAGDSISRADADARTMLRLYADAAEDSGHDAPHSARRQVSDAQECLLEAANRLHQGTQALSEYAHDIAPNLAGAVTTTSEYRPPGEELLEISDDRATRSARRARLLVRRLDDVSDAAHQEADAVQGTATGFRKLPEEPGPAASVTRQPVPDAPAVRPVDGGPSAGSIADSVVVVVAVVFGGRRFIRRMLRMTRARGGDGTA